MNTQHYKTIAFAIKLRSEKAKKPSAYQQTQTILNNAVKAALAKGN